MTTARIALILTSLVLGGCFSNEITGDVASLSALSWKTQSDFMDGDNDSGTVEWGRIPGEVRLKAKKYSLTHGETMLRSGTFHMAKPTEYSNNAITIGKHEVITMVETNDDLTQSSSAWHDGGDQVLFAADIDRIAVMDTKGTKSTTDDTHLHTYSMSSTPALTDNTIFDIVYDSTNSLLYTCNSNGGVDVIDMNGTPKNIADDTLLITYGTGSTPALATDRCWAIFLDETNGWLYISHSSSTGMSVIDRGGTINPADDVVERYHTGSTPALPHNSAPNVSFDGANNMIYMTSGGGGINIIDTQGTFAIADDTLTTFNTGTTPATSNNNIWDSFYDKTNNLLYLPASSSLDVIDTKGTNTTADDTLHCRYDSSNFPASDSLVWFGETLRHGRYLYMDVSGSGLMVFDTKNTKTCADDELVANLNLEETTANYQQTYDWFFDSDNDRLFVNGGNGLMALDLNTITAGGPYNSTAEYISPPIAVSNASKGLVKWQQTLTSGQTVEVSTRVGNANAAWIDEFNDGDTSNVEDIWSAIYTSVSESNGTLKLGGTAPQGNWAAFQVRASATPDFYPRGSTMKARLKVTTNNLSDYYDYFFFDGWEFNTMDYTSTNKWVHISLVTQFPLSKVGFEPIWTGTWDGDDTFEIDHIMIEGPDSSWDAWSAPCSNSKGCDIADTTGKSWVQYKFKLSTDDTTTTPSISEVTVANGYEAEGTYTSRNTVFGATFPLTSLKSTKDLPSGTSIEIEYSVDGGSNWTSIGNETNYSFPEGTTATQFMYRAIMRTTDENVTPALTSLEVL